MAKFATCYDITPNRCTVLECHDDRDDAVIACEDQDEIMVFEIDQAVLGSQLIRPGLRAYHRDGKVWS